MTSAARRGAAVLWTATVLLLGVLPGCGDGGTTPPASEGATAGPALSVAGLEGGAVRLAEPDTTTVVAFVASWCVPCRRELPELQRRAASADASTRFVAVAVQEEPTETRGLVADTGITFPVGSDPDGVALSDYGFTGLPGTLLLDGDGEVLHRYRGTIDFDDLDRRLAG